METKKWKRNVGWEKKSSFFNTEKLLGSMGHIYVTICNAYETIYWKRLQDNILLVNIKVKLNRIEGWHNYLYMQVMPQLTERSKLPNTVDSVIKDTMNLKHLYQVCHPGIHSQWVCVLYSEQLKSHLFSHHHYNKVLALATRPFVALKS
jgi:hypothetical protein